MLKMNFNLKEYLNCVTSIDPMHIDLDNEIKNAYEMKIDHYTNFLIQLILYYKTSLEKEKMPEEMYLINQGLNNFTLLAETWLPYYYINFIKKLLALSINTIDIILNEHFEKEKENSYGRPDQHVILIRRYMGMGHYLVLSTFLNNINNNINDKNYFIWVVGGANSLDQEGNWFEFNNLNKGVLVIKGKMKTFKDAIYNLVTYDIKTAFDSQA